MKKFDSFPGGIQHRRFGDLYPAGEMDKLVLIKAIKALGAADSQRDLSWSIDQSKSRRVFGSMYFAHVFRPPG